MHGKNGVERVQEQGRSLRNVWRVRVGMKQVPSFFLPASSSLSLCLSDVLCFEKKLKFISKF